jgi:L-ribulose-5-phosphate 4-epimerase
MTQEDLLFKRKQDITTYSRLVYERGLVGSAGGNVSMRHGQHFLITAGGVSLRDVTADHILLVDQKGAIVQGISGLKPSKETMMHLRIYLIRKEIDSVIHAHPTYVTGYSVRDKPVPMVTASARNKLIEVPMVEYADPGSIHLAELVERAVEKAPQHVKAVILKNHGILAFDQGMGNCFDIAELVEDTAKIAFVADTLSLVK